MENKMEKIKGIWIGDGVASTGFARVNHEIIERLDPDKFDIHHIAINYFGDPHPYSHKIYPASLGGDIYGIERLRIYIGVYNPIFFLY
jgi:hypothetical protein